MISESEIRNGLEAVSQNRLDVFVFAEWLDSKSWGMHRDSSVEAIRLASAAERILAEYDYHHNDSALRLELARLLPAKPAKSCKIWESVSANVAVKVSMSFDSSPRN